MALESVLRALPEQPASAAGLAKFLGLNRKIAWQVWRIVETGEEEMPAQVLPGPTALEGFLRACGARGVPPDRLEAAREASRRFEDLAVLHGGDRASLMSLLRQAAGGAPIDDRASESIRRQAFHANSEIWGIQTQTYIATAILAPSEQHGRVDDLALVGEIGVRRLRADAARVVTGIDYQGADGAPCPNALVRVDPGSGLIEPMVPRFSSARVRVLPSGSGEPGQTRVELVESPVGRRGEVDLLLAQFCKGVGRRFATDTFKRIHFALHLSSPYAVVVHDLLVRRDLWTDVRPVCKVYSALRGWLKAAERDERDVLPIRVETRRLGSGLSALATPHVPNYIEMVDWACGQVGWKPEQFEAWRCVLQYPPMPSSMVMGVDLPLGGGRGG